MSKLWWHVEGRLNTSLSTCGQSLHRYRSSWHHCRCRNVVTETRFKSLVCWKVFTCCWQTSSVLCELIWPEWNKHSCVSKSLALHIKKELQSDKWKVSVGFTEATCGKNHVKRQNSFLLILLSPGMVLKPLLLWSQYPSWPSPQTWVEILTKVIKVLLLGDRNHERFETLVILYSGSLDKINDLAVNSDELCWL